MLMTTYTLEIDTDNPIEPEVISDLFDRHVDELAVAVGDDGDRFYEISVIAKVLVEDGHVFQFQAWHRSADDVEHAATDVVDITDRLAAFVA